jgi:hypothetical protein
MRLYCCLSTSLLLFCQDLDVYFEKNECLLGQILVIITVIFDDIYRFEHDLSILDYQKLQGSRFCS